MEVREDMDTESSRIGFVGGYVVVGAAANTGLGREANKGGIDILALVAVKGSSS